jgi:hypothetical protein
MRQKNSRKLVSAAEAERLASAQATDQKCCSALNHALFLFLFPRHELPLWVLDKRALSHA